MGSPSANRNSERTRSSRHNPKWDNVCALPRQSMLYGVQNRAPASCRAVSMSFLNSSSPPMPRPLRPLSFRIGSDGSRTLSTSRTRILMIHGTLCNRLTPSTCCVIEPLCNAFLMAETDRAFLTTVAPSSFSQLVQGLGGDLRGELSKKKLLGNGRCGFYGVLKDDG